jgi:RNA polymerase sigma factor (sigma-70 family)
LATAPLETFIRQLRQIASLSDEPGETDGKLLGSFIDQKNEAAFSALVQRHGPMVLGVCRRVLRNEHDAEDAFQVTFLVLARRASVIRPRGLVANWLHGVAHRTALRARRMSARRQVQEKQVLRIPEPEISPRDEWHDLQSLIDQELSGLPEIYRLPILLCDLEGKTIKEATRQLGWPQGTLAGRLARGRKLLAKRLTNRGVVLSVGSLATLFAQHLASVGVPASLMTSTVKAATLIAAGHVAIAGVVSAKVAHLMEGVLMSMMLTNLKKVTAVVLLLGLVGFGGGMLLRPKATGQETRIEQPGDTGSEKENALRREAVPGTQIQRPALAFRDERLQGEWTARIEDVNISIFFGPGNSIRRVTEGRFTGADDTGTYSVDWSRNPHHLDVRWGSLPAGQTIMEFTESGSLRIQVGGDGETRPRAFSDETWVLTKKEKAPARSKQADQAAEKDLALADFYRSRRKFGSAQFYYELIRYRYPGTAHATKALQGIEDLKKYRIRRPDGSEGWVTFDEDLRPQPPPRIVHEATTPTDDIGELGQKVRILERRLSALESPGKAGQPAYAGRAASAEVEQLRQRIRDLERRVSALEANRKQGAVERTKRVGSIFVVGNTKTPDSEILEKMDLFPGQVLDEKALRAAEKNLEKFNASVEAIDTGDSDYKDILVKVKKE